MELTTGQQRLLFFVVVLALAGLGFYLLDGRGSGGSPGAASSPSATASSAPSATGTASAGVPPATVPAATPVSTAGGAEIYQWLPFTPDDLSAAAKTTLEFATAYTTWSYTEDTTAYAAKLNGLVTSDELPVLESAYATQGVAAQRTGQKQVSKGSGTIDSIRSFAAGTITFLVTLNQQVTSTQPTSTQSGQWAVTVLSSAGGWQVNDIELAKLGNS
ncbi:hypothetical protein EAS64_07425 [Trebonia kvetii]|uniref:Uncharacterized protein n=1 Tax=Trebonia kvetii TaxID=2480626 RepID=A0A6P2CB05_9ACTN|nr:hypothetical protein [Trebonia kvetii]TVZ07131.1 hypothetical protein EAS64_07425 [Trebonia kvetii]